MASELEPTLGLPAPFPSSPKRPPKYVVRIENKATGLFYVTNFCEMYAFKYLVSIILDDREWEWKDEKTIQASDGLSLKSDDLEECIEYKMTTKEKQWVPPSPYYGEWHKIATGQELKPQKRTKAEDDAEKPEKRTKAKSDDDTSTKRERPQRAPKASREGLVQLADIAQALKLEPKQCRVALRKSKTEKPDAGWAWPQGEVEAVKALILKHHK